MTNRVIEGYGYLQSVACSDPATPNPGDPVRYGSMTGVAATKEADGGNPANVCSVDFGPGTFNLSVKGVNGSGNATINAGDKLYYVDADTPKLSAKTTGVFFGIAMAGVTSGATATIPVFHLPPGA